MLAGHLSRPAILYLVLVIAIIESKKKSHKKETCDALESKTDCAKNAQGPMSSLSMGGDGAQDKELAKELRRIEAEYLKRPLTADEKAKPEVVQHITQQLIMPTLKEHHAGLSYMGSNYEYSTVPRKSDYDIQFFIKIPIGRQNHATVYSATADGCGDEAWRYIRRGPEHLTEGGFLSAVKVRKLIQSKIDKAAQCHSLQFQGSPITIKRAVSGPATTLNAEWRGQRVSVDIVACLRAEDVENSGGHDFVGKPYKGQLKHKDGIWRLSYSKKELNKLREMYKSSERKLILLRIMKVIKQHVPQLRYFASYFYKNLLFMVNEDKPSLADWDRVSLPERFKDMIKIMYDALECQTLLLHFNRKVNYLADKDPNKIQEIANFLKGIINNNKYVDLIKRVPSH